MVDTDCAGTCGGDAAVDECGQCDGNGIADGACDCDGSVLDCAGDCGGDAVVDECGECAGDGLNFMCDDGTMACNEDSCNSFDGCDLPDNNLYLMGNDVLYNSVENIGGFQFGVDGADIINAYGGDAENAAFTISSSASTVLGFSFDGSVIPAGCGVLLTMSLDGEGVALSDIIISDAIGNSLGFNYFDGDEDCPSGLYDCTDVCDGSSLLDDCGVCNGLNDCYGCTDETALNFDTDASFDDGSCEYFDYSGSIVITEIHYNPSLALQGLDEQYEFIELYNNSEEVINFNNWTLQSSNIELIFSDNISLSPSEYLLLSRDSGIYENSVSWGDERLENSSDSIGLFDNANQLVDFVEYFDANPWPAAADAGGSSLELLNIDLDNNNAISWQASYYLGGTPGLMNFIPIYGCIDNNACNFDLNATIDNGTCDYAELNFDCDGNCTEVIDCAGVCNGDSILDNCGVCNGDGQDCTEGCTDIVATNYNVNAIIDDGSCFYAGDNYPYWDDNLDSILDNYTNYEFSMSVTSLVYINDSSVLGENDMLAAFVNNELRGISQALLVPTALGHALSFQNLIYSNLENGEIVNFKYYNFESDTIYELNEIIDYNVDTFLGDVNNPFLFTYSLNNNYYSMNLDNTGNSALFIFTDDIDLNYGDEIGLFDLNGIQSTSLDCISSPGETLVGSGVWQNQQVEIVAIESVDLCEFGGFLLGGFQTNNAIVIKVFSNVDQMEYYAIPNYTIGENIWGQPIYVINNLELVPEAEFFIELDPLLLNLISLNISTDNSQLENMFNDDILLIFDDESNFYIPDYSVNQIGNYNYAEGYMLFSLSEEEVEMNMTGQLISHDHPIVLEPYKANMVPYFHESCLPVEYAFSSIADQLLLVKDDEGQYYIPGAGINTLNSICPGNGYIIFTSIDSDITFHYPQMLLNREIISNEENIKNTELLLDQHNIYKTGLSTPIIIDDFLGSYNINDDIIIYANDLKVGAEKITGNFPLTVSAWKSFEVGDLILPGYNQNDVINIKLYNYNEGKYISLDQNLNALSFGDKQLVRGTVSNNNEFIPQSFSINNIYPNPFNPTTNISLNINMPGLYEFTVYNLRGQVVHSAQMQYDIPGSHSISWNGDNNASGTYIATVRHNQQFITRKLTLIK